MALEVSEPRLPCFKLGMRMGDAGFVDDFDAPSASARTSASSRRARSARATRSTSTSGTVRGSRSTSSAPRTATRRSSSSSDSSPIRPSATHGTNGPAVASIGSTPARDRTDRGAASRVHWPPCARSSTDRASDYGSEGWGFESLRAREDKVAGRGRFPVPGTAPAALREGWLLMDLLMDRPGREATIGRHTAPAAIGSCSIPRVWPPERPVRCAAFGDHRGSLYPRNGRKPQA